MESTTLFFVWFSYHAWNLQLFFLVWFLYHTWNLQLFLCGFSIIHGIYNSFFVVAVVGGVGGRLSGGFVPTEKLTRKKKKSHLLSMKGQMSFVLHDPPLHPVSSSL